MPLVVLCGLPCSGKTTRATELKESFSKERSDENILLITDDRTDYLRNAIYADSKKEKDFRSGLKSDVQRLLSKDTVLILDSSNYIKGYRYELYCMTKSLKTTHCVILCDTDPETGWKWNLQKDEPQQYNQQIFDNLVQRFECPESRNRWDSPLFVVHPEDVLPIQDINDVLLHRKPPPPNQSTQNQPLASTNFLFELDKITQDVVKIILEAKKNNLMGDITIPGATDKVLWISDVTPSSLGRLRRQFITYTKSHPIEDTMKIASFFVHYLNRSID